MKGLAIQLKNDPQLLKVLRPVFRIRRNAQEEIVSGLVVDSTQAQNEALILASNPGEFKNRPTMGVGLENALLGDTSDLLTYRHEARRCYKMEGLEIEKLDLFDLKKINIKARYK